MIFNLEITKIRLNLGINYKKGVCHYLKMTAITKDMTIGEVIAKHPETAQVMLSYGLHCVGCHVAASETLEQGARAHGMDDKAVDKMIKEMNDMAEKKDAEESTAENTKEE